MATKEKASIYCEGKVRFFRLLHMTCVEARDTLFQIYQWGTQDKDPGEPLDKYLHETLGYSKAKIKNSFLSDQRDQIKKDFLGSSFDVSLLGQAIPQACKGIRRPLYPWVMSETEDRLLSLVCDIKNFRNTFIHMQPFTIEEDKFDEKTEILRELLKEVLTVGAAYYEIPQEQIDTLVKELHEKLNKTREDYIENWDITSYENQSLLIQRQKVLLTVGKEQLVKTYKFFTQVSPASFLTGSNIHLNVGIVFTLMEIVESASSDIRDVEYTEILDYAQTETINNGSISDVLLIEGIAGVGKTTLTKLMISQWGKGSSEMLHLKDFDMLIYFECRNGAIESFTQLLETLFMPQVTSRFKEGDLKKCVLSLKLLIIADGLDELNKSSKKVMQEILDLVSLISITLVCTSRPEYITNFKQMVPCGQHITHIKIRGIPLNRRIEFVLKYHDELIRTGFSQQKSAGLVEFLDKTAKQLEEHWRLPLNLVLLTIMWALAPTQMNNVTSATELYKEFTTLNKQRLIKKLVKHEKTCSFTLEELDEKLDRFILHLSWEALISLKEDCIDSLPENSIKRLKDACSTLELPYEPVLSAFLVEGIINTETRSESVFSIAHKGLQDYLAAHYIIQALRGNDLRFDIASIIKSIQSHPSYGTESLRHSFILHTMKYLGTMLEEELTVVSVKEQSKATLNPVDQTSQDSATNGREAESKATLNPVDQTSQDSATNGREAGPTSIQCVLEGLYGIKKVPTDISRYQNTFAYTAGLLDEVPDIIRPKVAEEIVNLFLKSGALDKEQWFDFITEMKCHESVTKSIATLVPNIVSGTASISDSLVKVYSKLLPYGKPKAVKINMANNPEEIPHLESLIMNLAKEKNCTVHVHLNYNFRNAVAASSLLDDGLRELFQSCKVPRFMGRLSEENAPFLPATVERLAVVVDKQNAYAMGNLFFKLAEKPSPLTVLSVHVVPGAEPAALQALPGIGDLILYISDVQPAIIPWACEVMEKLQPTGLTKKFTNILFPRCHLNTEGFIDLLHKMRSHQVKVSGDGIIGGVAVASPYIPPDDNQTLMEFTKEILGCTFRRSEEEAIWPKIIGQSDSAKARNAETRSGR